MKIPKEAKIGLFAIITIALLVWGANFLKGKSIFKSTDSYYSVYNNIGGLIESGIIYFNGYKIGTVGKVKFEANKNGRLVVEFVLEEKVYIPKNSFFEIYSSSLVSGIKEVRLVTTNETELYEPGDTIPGRVDKGLADIINPIKIQVESAVDKLDTLLFTLNNLLNEETVSDLQSTFNHIEGISSTLDNGKIDKTLSNLAVFSDSLKKSSGHLKNMLANLDMVSDSLSDSHIKSAINNANVSLAKLSDILKKIENGEGSAGMLVNNDSLYVNLENAAKNLDLLLSDLKDNPKRYVHFSLFGKKVKE